MKYPLAQPFSLSAAEVVSLMRTDSANGLGEHEAGRRRNKFGSNTYPGQERKNSWLILLEQFRSPIVYLLFFGAGVSFYFKDIPEGASILVVILINALIGFLMEMQARSSMNALKKWR
ncbi:cation-transporting P-type ATPase [Mucilaginibacter sp. S1162]|uniref:Cation-transporting P-type ATPase n=1 Tax=Mucilaginibacter humi TaxID=2732510 RepID=A0ABX1W0D3_9SPHI|nr:cation-transporting P-type ATPase [Mucilaginibacter humi]NNU33398.1 cation-transporting P-type ATPase [Mucilaginibacter humi]